MRGILIAVIGSIGLVGCSLDDRTVLERLQENLLSLETIEYKADFRAIDTRMGRDRNDSAICFFDFRSDDTLIGSKYHINANYGENVFDGEMNFRHYNDDKIIKYINNPKKYDVSNSPFMYGSVYSLRKLLPVFMKDTSIVITQESDTTIGGENYYYFKFVIENGFIQIGAEIEKSYGFSANKYLLISQKDYMPFEWGEIKSEGAGYSKHRFRNYNYSATRADSVWSYDRFPPDYLRISMKDYFETHIAKSKLRNSDKAPDWTLPLLEGDSVSLAKQSGDLVLLDFWYFGCVACTKAIPEINEIHKKYRERGLKVYSIEFLNTESKHLVKYIEKHGVEYPMLYDGKNVGKAYGVMAAPWFFLIDKDRKIAYSKAGLKKAELIEAIETNL